LARTLTLVAALLTALAVAPPAAAADPSAHMSKTCADYDNQRDAQLGADTRDADGDGIYCESLPCPCLKPGQGGSGGGGGGNRGGSTPKPRKTAQVFHARVVSVIDGDTIRVRTIRGKRRTMTVRLIGIDTPESRRPGRPVECGAKEAAASLRRMAFHRGQGRRVKLTTDPTQDTYDRYRRLLAYVETTTGRQLNVSQIAYGLAKTYVYAGKAFRQVSRFRAAERRARRAKRGVWGQCGGNFHRRA